MSDVGMQPRGDANSPRGISFVKVVKPAKIISRHCVPGDVIRVEPTSGTVWPANDGLTEDYAETLIRLGIVKQHQRQPNDRPLSVRPQHPRTKEDPPVESAMLAPQKRSEQATARPQRGAV